MGTHIKNYSSNLFSHKSFIIIINLIINIHLFFVWLASVLYSFTFFSCSCSSMCVMLELMEINVCSFLWCVYFFIFLFFYCFEQFKSVMYNFFDRLHKTKSFEVSMMNSSSLFMTGLWKTIYISFLRQFSFLCARLYCRHLTTNNVFLFAAVRLFFLFKLIRDVPWCHTNEDLLGI